MRRRRRSPALVIAVSAAATRHLRVAASDATGPRVLEGASAVGGAASQKEPIEDFDLRCIQQPREADPARCHLGDPCRFECWSHFFSHSYCCLEDSTCWRWGRLGIGPVLRVDAARSGVECRYVCQAEPSCEEWTFLIPAGLDIDAAGPCLMHGDGRGGGDSVPPEELGNLSGSVVSGLRICLPGAGAAPSTSPGDSQQRGRFDLEHPSLAADHHFNASLENFQEAAARALLEDGWVVVHHALDPGRAVALKSAAADAAHELLKRDLGRLGNRGPRRYSWGGASVTHHMVHLGPWAELLDTDAISSVLRLVFGGNYVAVGGGGDFVLEGTDTHQKLHVDLQLEEMYDRAFPPAAIAVNFAVDNISCTDGPTRFIPGTQRTPLSVAQELTRGPEFLRASSLETEEVSMRTLGLKTVLACPMAPGDALIRDMRLWHGGTPNRGPNMRLMPSAEFLSPWYAELTAAVGTDHFTPRPALPLAHWLRMSDHGRAVTKRILSAPGPVQSGMRPDFVLLLPYVAEDRA